MKLNTVPFLRVACFCAAATLTLAPVHAEDLLVAQVPFAFQMSTKTFSPGTYRILRNGSVLLMRNVASGEGALSVAPRIETRDANPESRLVFLHYGGSYYLSQISSAEGEWILPLGSKEREIARRSLNPPTKTVAALKR